jgi:hypothetical protein
MFKSGLNVFEQSRTDNKCTEIQLHIAKTLSDNLPRQTKSQIEASDFDRERKPEKISMQKERHFVGP